MKGSRPLKDREVWATSRKLDARGRALFMLGICCGFRISELLSLRVGDVEQHGRLVSAVTVSRKSMKGKIEGRTVPLARIAGKAVAELLKELRSVRRFLPKEEFLFMSRKGGALSRVQAWRILAQAFAVNKMSGKLGTHSMRKTFAAKIYERLNRDLLKTQRALGHRTITSTISYLSFAESDITKAVLDAWG